MQLENDTQNGKPRAMITIGVKTASGEVSDASIVDAKDTRNIISSAVDWFSATTKDDDMGTEWFRAFCKYRQRYPLLIFDWYHQGGYKGQKCVGVYYGESTRYGYLIKATGNSAPEVVNWIFLLGLRKARVTRIDLRVDVLLYLPDLEMASNIFYENLESKRPTFKLVKASEGKGETVYVGSPQSESSCRIYDKGAQLGHKAGVHWRFEVMYRKPIATLVFEDYRDAWTKKKLREFIPATVGSWLVSRGLKVPWDHNVVEVPVIVKEKTPWENKIEWLKRSVAKTVQLLIQAGFEEQVKEALGIDQEIIS